MSSAELKIEGKCKQTNSRPMTVKKIRGNWC
jgi:hypothetical protein